METLTLSLLQSDIVWENTTVNLDRVAQLLAPLTGNTDIAVLPEMFTTGFSMNSNDLAEPNDGYTLTRVREWASTYQMAIAGSFIATQEGKYYNRGFFITPEGKEFFYDKRHLFSIGEEDKHFSAGDEQFVVEYRGWHIALFICYDLRFPVWSRNCNNRYDVALYTANWPRARSLVWKTLLTARALENSCYVAGVNRVGCDGLGIHYTGDSGIISYRGEWLATATPNTAQIVTHSLSLEALHSFREKFPTWRDADSFTLHT